LQGLYCLQGDIMTRQVFGPASEKQRMVLQDNTTDVILVGGGKFCASTLKTIL
jgi:hypothetical protein